MSNDCEVYVDPEEDEVFFGCVSEREKNICAKFCQQSDYIGGTENKCDLSENIKNIGPETDKEKTSDSFKASPLKENNTFSDSIEQCQSYLNNTTLELEHNYSTPMKHKIDKTILKTPKSVVKADKDGGFLKVLSEIAIVKAEVEGHKKIKDENKENKQSKIIPDILITEATPVKAKLSITQSTNLKKHKVSTSPKSEDTKKEHVKSPVKNSVNKSPNNENEKNILNNGKRESKNASNQSINLCESQTEKNNTVKEKLSAIETAKKSVSPRKQIAQNKDVVAEDKAVQEKIKSPCKSISTENLAQVEEKNNIQNPANINGVNKKLVEEKNNIPNATNINVINKKPVEEKHMPNTSNIYVVNNKLIEDKNNCQNEEDSVENKKIETNDRSKRKSKILSTKNLVDSNMVKKHCNVIPKDVFKKSLKACYSDPVEKLFRSKSDIHEQQTTNTLDREPTSISLKDESELVELNYKDKLELFDGKFNKIGDANDNSNFQEIEKNKCKPVFSKEIFQPPTDDFETPKPLPEIRISEEARMVIDLIKKSSVDDTINSTIEDGENSFISFENMSLFDSNVNTLKGGNNKKKSLKVSLKSPKLVTKFSPKSSVGFESKKVQKFSPRLKITNNLTHQPYTVEKHKFTPSTSQIKAKDFKYYSDRKVNTEKSAEVRKCVKKLPLDGKKTESTEEKNKCIKDQNTITSRIPVFGLKPSRIAVPAKTTPMKTPTGKIFKNSKYKNIESPINAYINSKTTPLVQNIKAEDKKSGIVKPFKSHIVSNSTKVQEKTTALKPTLKTKLPFVQYKSATPYKIEKQPESRLPRLAPKVKKLIGTNSPTVLKHEGRFYLKDNKRPASSNDTTIAVEPNEVSLIISQPAQKSNSAR